MPVISEVRVIGAPTAHVCTSARDQLRIAIVTWIERTYHRRRRQAGLGKLTPIEYESIMTATAAQAA